nr:hypothetical protein [Marinobacter changyiensis]
MRNKEYHGALRLFQGYPMLMSPRSQEQVVSIDELEATKGKPLDQRELNMARQLISMLEARFDPEEYQDEYRGRVLELIEKKQKGDRIKRPRQRPEKPMDDISKALEASLEGMENGR